jgi:hypothetical protein
MKQLKFMLAAATAVGIAAAAQAAVNTVKTIDNENFEDDSFVADTAATNYPGYSFAGENPADDESVIKAGGYNSTKALQVNTGTDPLLRALDYSTSGGTANDINLSNVDSLYIDAKVQFTVTPIGDSVVNGDDDKLMIYLQQTNEVTIVEDKEVTNTVNKLMVRALQYKPATAPYWDETLEMEMPGEPAIQIPGAWEVKYVDDSAVTVVPQQQYKLTVTTALINGVPMFKIFLGGKEIKPVENLYLAVVNSSYFPSLKGAESTALTHVGFAGEGKVDDLLVWTEKTVTTVDFTLAVTGGSAVSVTIGDTDYNFVDGKVSLPAGATFTVNYTVDAFAYTLAWSNLTGCEADDATVTLAAGAETPSATLTLTVATGDDATPPTVPNNATAASVGITSPAFTEAQPEELQKLITWAAKKGVSKTAVNEIPPFEATTGNATNTVQEAYLLNCALSDVATEKANFKFTADDLADLVKHGFGATGLDINTDKDYNGEFVLEGATKLDNPDWATTHENPMFFRARLKK